MRGLGNVDGWQSDDRFSARAIVIFSKTFGACCLLGLFLFAGGHVGIPSAFGGFTGVGFSSLFLDAATQKVIFLFLGLYFVTLLSVRFRKHLLLPASGMAVSRNALSPAWDWAAQIARAGEKHAAFWLACGFFISVLRYAIDYKPSAEALILLAGVVVGQGAAVWAESEAGGRRPLVRLNIWSLSIFLLAFLLAVASVWNFDGGSNAAYRGNVRWCGPWDNPNIFGLLMGTGVVLATGLALQGLPWRDPRRWGMPVRWREPAARPWLAGLGKYAAAIVCVVAAGLLARGLFHSFSRGAWAGTVCGVLYLLGNRIISRLRQTRVADRGAGANSGLTGGWRLGNYWLPGSVILLSAGVLCFWHFRQSDWHPAQRVFSATKAEDFSARNRVAAWEGDLHITADHPWFGAAWDRAEPLYEYYYLPPKLSEGMAIQMNDYLMLGSTLGVPALFCFAMYVWLTLRGRGGRGAQKTERWCARAGGAGLKWAAAERDWQRAICRAGAIVLLVGLWFDGGLFKLPTAATFWILLELGARAERMSGAELTGRQRPQRLPRSRRAHPCATKKFNAPAHAGGLLRRPAKVGNTVEVLDCEASEQ